MNQPPHHAEDGVVGDDEPPPPGPSIVCADDRAEPDIEVDLDVLAALLGDVLRAEGASSQSEASLTLVDPHHIAELKVRHLDGDGSATDVLSFPVDGIDADAELVGDVVLCPAIAAGQAGAHAGRFEDELALLVVHGALHLAGWDHAEDEQRREMWSRERELLAAFGRLPIRDPWNDPPVQGVPTSSGADR